ncbi:MAG: IS1182 family transposase [Deltaproteobacteria bacterium]|nr:MAG: IS1182 family transposase [Deltaproteobacteria bacterium]
MSLQPQNDFTIPEETTRIAHRAFREPSAVMRLRDELGVVYRDHDFAELFSTQGQPGVSPALLAMVIVMQYMEGLSDRQAADAVRGRIDWKYALGLALDDAGFDFTVLSTFRQRLLAGAQETYLLDRLLQVCHERQLLKSGKQRTDSTHVLGAVRTLNRLELVMETLRHALNHLAQQAPTWLQQQVTADWFDRYGARVRDYRLPQSQAKREALARQVGIDGYHLLASVRSATASSSLWQVPAVETLRQVWIQQYYRTETSVEWRKNSDLAPGALRICSPHDVEVRASRKRTLDWVGYKVHLTETCADDAPHLVTHVQTTPSTQADSDALAPIHAALTEKGLAPQSHLVDAGYPSAPHLVESQAQEIDLVCRVQQDTRWQALRADSYGLDAFTIDWEAKQVHCPQGQTSRTWSEGTRKEEPVIRVQFAREQCLSCSARSQCTTAQTRGRSLQLHPQPRHEALQRARQRQHTQAFQQQYAKRAGVEGTISQATRSFSLRRSRYVGMAKSHLQHIFSAVALNFSRLADWFASDYQRAQTPISPFARLAPT